MKNILTWSFWFNGNPPALLPLFFNLLIAVVVLFLISTIIFYFLKNKKNVYQKIKKNLFDFSFGNFLIGLLVLFFNYERITFFSARFWLIIWFLIIVVWLFFSLIKIKEIPKRQEERKKQEEFKKYIP